MGKLRLQVWVAQPYHFSLVVPSNLSTLDLVTKIETTFQETFGMLIQVMALQDRNYNGLPLTDMKVGLLLQNDDKVYVILNGSNLRTLGHVGDVQRIGSPSSPMSPMSTSPSSPSSPTPASPSPLSPSNTPIGLDTGLQTYFKLRSNIDNVPSTLPEADLILQRCSIINDVLKKKRGREIETREDPSREDSSKPDVTSLSPSRKELLVKLGRYMTTDIAKLMDNSNRRHAFSPVTKLKELSKKRKMEEEMEITE